MGYLGNVPHLDNPIIKFLLDQEMIEFLYFFGTGPEGLDQQFHLGLNL